MEKPHSSKFRIIVAWFFFLVFSDFHSACICLPEDAKLCAAADNLVHQAVHDRYSCDTRGFIPVFRYPHHALKYRNYNTDDDPKFSDRQVLTNSADRDQTAPLKELL